MEMVFPYVRYPGATNPTGSEDVMEDPTSDVMKDRRAKVVMAWGVACTFRLRDPLSSGQGYWVVRASVERFREF